MLASLKQCGKLTCPVIIEKPEFGFEFSSMSKPLLHTNNLQPKPTSKTTPESGA
jgi:hypothetical protein